MDKTSSALYWYKFHQKKKLLQGDLDSSPAEKIAQILEKILVLQPGLLILEPDDIRQLISILKHNPNIIALFYRDIQVYLKKRSNRLKYLSLSLIDIVFRKSNSFRLLLTPDIYKLFVPLFTVKLEKYKKLPLFTTKLLTLAKTILNGWELEFGEGYKQLRIGVKCLKGDYGSNYEYLDKIINRDKAFSQLKLIGPVKNDTKIRLMRKIAERRLSAIQADIDEQKRDISIIAQEMECLFKLIADSGLGHSSSKIVPETSYIDTIFTNIFKTQFGDHTNGNQPHRLAQQLELDLESEPGLASESAVNEDSELDELLGLYQSSKQSVSVIIDPSNIFSVTKTKDNAILFDALADDYRLLNKKYQPIVDSWISTIVRLANLEDVGELLGKAVSAKAILDGISAKFEKIGGHQQIENFESDEDEFEQVDIDATAKDQQADQAFEGIYSDSEESDDGAKKSRENIGFKLPSLDYIPKKKYIGSNSIIKSYVPPEEQVLEKARDQENQIKWSDIQKNAEDVAINTNQVSKKTIADISKREQEASNQEKKKRKLSRDNGNARETQYSRLNRIMSKRR